LTAALSSVVQLSLTSWLWVDCLTG
jgi:hypothetical protein